MARRFCNSGRLGLSLDVGINLKEETCDWEILSLLSYYGTLQSCPLVWE